jgi:hypothetical protein
MSEIVEMKVRSSNGLPRHRPLAVETVEMYLTSDVIALVGG